jgi:hypothetical protein
MIDKLICMVQWSPIWSNFNLDRILFGRKSVKYDVADESLKMSSTYKYFGGGVSLIFSSDELLPYTSTNLYESNTSLFNVSRQKINNLILLMIQKLYSVLCLSAYLLPK